MRILSTVTAVAAVAIGATCITAVSQEAHKAALGSAASAQRIHEAAIAFLESLSEPQRAALTFPLEGEDRTNWSNTPSYVHPRPGLRMGDLSNEQRLRAHNLLRASMSSQGYQKVAGVMRLDDIGRARTLEDLVKEMLRPMLKSWLDDNLPGLVERIVRAEIERVSRGR